MWINSPSSIVLFIKMQNKLTSTCIVDLKMKTHQKWLNKWPLVKSLLYEVWNCVRIFFFSFLYCVVYLGTLCSEAASVSLCSFASFLASWVDCLDEAFQVIKWLKLKHILQDYFHCFSPHVHWIKCFIIAWLFVIKLHPLHFLSVFVTSNFESTQEKKWVHE